MITKRKQISSQKKSGRGALLLPPAGGLRTDNQDVVTSRLLEMRGAGLEPASLAAHAPQACMFASFITRALATTITESAHLFKAVFR